MSALSIQPTYPIFTDRDGYPLEDGYVYIGAKDLDPRTNPINVFWDAALTIPVSQPIRTNGGYPWNNGAVGRLYVNSDYSIVVLDKKSLLIYSAPSATERYSDVIITGGSNSVSQLQRILVGGTGNAITFSTTPTFANYTLGQSFWWIAIANNTGATTLQGNGISPPANLIKNPNLLMEGGEIRAGMYCEAICVNATASPATFLLKTAYLEQSDTPTFATAVGTADNFNLGFSPQITKLLKGQKFSFVAIGDNTGSVTLTLGAIPTVGTIYKNVGQLLEQGDIKSGMLCNIECTEVTPNLKFTLLNPMASSVITQLSSHALPFPCIGTADNFLPVTPIANPASGGQVSIGAGVLLSLGEEISPGVGQYKTLPTVAFTSANLNVNTTYYLRAQITAGSLVVYTQIGTDSDPIPPTLKGTPNGLSGGGFDSTKFDMLISKIQTGALNTLPTVTPLKNHTDLFFDLNFFQSFNRQILSVQNASQAGYYLFTQPNNNGILIKGAVQSLNINWARTPTFKKLICDLSTNLSAIYNASGGGTVVEKISVPIYKGFNSEFALTNSLPNLHLLYAGTFGTLNPLTAIFTRYQILPVFQYQIGYNSPINSPVPGNIDLTANFDFSVMA